MRFKNLLQDERGQILPYLAVSLVIMILFAAVGLGGSAVYRDRMNVRDALDAAAAAALSEATRESKPTWYIERVTDWDNVPIRDEDGHIIGHRSRPSEWGATTSGEKDYLVVDRDRAEAAARAYFARNMVLDQMEYTILDWDFDLKYEERRVQLVKDRPHLPETSPYPGVSTKTWEENFPRWAEVTIRVRVETPVPMGSIVNQETVVTNLETSYRKSLR